MATCLVAGRAAADLARPSGKTILTVGGRIRNTNDGAEAIFDLAMLDALGNTSFTTSTPWTDKPNRWEGVPLATLMAAVGADGTTLRATALNDYVVDMPLAGLDVEGAILADRRNGVPMPISDKGPLFIVYPFDDRPELRKQAVYMRCAWQVARLDVL
ncbi:oxidoreductase [Mangrovibrevibacter kandeliae]|uniref:oxidoreductase n=1 Tax=Mangrovibrevibacter kandeliae TaxID=2968473 RepID=UPI002118EDA6|nr:oxidoreductase [Aurantimonas sp. CSK15Z-1]MCQ8782460.1 oxidoreductase [Aurantimonas sp. CSK15Z-1]